jgi:hypothetical protein
VVGVGLGVGAGDVQFIRRGRQKAS